MPETTSRKRSRSRSRSPNPRDRKRPTSSSARATTNNSLPSKPEPPRRSSRSRSPPRQRKRPGAASRITAADREAAEKLRQGRLQQEAEEAKREAAARGVHDVVKQHYNAVPERGRDWRKTESKIKGLRSFNNWVKSALIRKFSPDENFNYSAGLQGGAPQLLVLDIGCGKGGDLQKWQLTPQQVGLYVGCDPADVSIQQAKERYRQMQTGRPRGRRPQYPLFEGHFFVKDCFGEWLGDIPFIREVGIDPNVGPGVNQMAQRWSGTASFDVVSMMFCMHYAFENETKARGMLRNVAGALKKGGRFLGVIPNSDVLSEKVEEYHKSKHSNGAAAQVDDDDDDWDPEKSLDDPKPPQPEESKENGEDGEVRGEGFEWGNSIYRVKFPGKTPSDGIFRPPFGWKYFYFLEEAVEEVPEYVVPWEAFRALAEDYNLELQYRRPFNEVWNEEKDVPEMVRLSEVMNVRDRRTGELMVSPQEIEAASFYHAFCFYKV
ncbi:guanine-N(7)-methyltransferase [Patellaria atrata CBS 101060]|uniref:mRNA cap guanine-N(7) methyltransferase n=1 Tax=Patellaria atrata CBS 101060 TaxID=1346257 RepID=A0A9P4S779_9PEZI|nr:guanine-N(7)-methyltransferase [Patellaria atrata CBS 101060]